MRKKEIIQEMYVSDRNYSVFYRLFVLALVAIPVAAFLLGNGWLSLGILFFLLSSWIALVTVPALLAFSLWTWIHQGFSFTQYGTFFLACSIGGFLLFTIARKKISVEIEEQDDVSFAGKEDFQEQLKAALQDTLH